MRLSGGDVLMHTGDATGRGRVEEFKPFIEWFSSQDYLHKVFVAGNHDWGLYLDGTRREIEDLLRQKGIHYLRDSEVTLDVRGQKLRVYGTPWTPTFGEWAFMRDRAEGNLTWDDVPRKALDVLLGHGPPKGMGDLVRANTVFEEQTGCYDLNRQLPEIGAAIYGCGHIHEGRGWDWHEPAGGGHRTLVLNTAILDETYSPQGGAITVEYDPSTRTVARVKGCRQGFPKPRFP